MTKRNLRHWQKSSKSITKITRRHIVIKARTTKKKLADKSYFDCIIHSSASSLKILLEGTGLRSMQKEKEWSGWDLNSEFFFHICCF